MINEFFPLNMILKKKCYNIFNTKILLFLILVENIYIGDTFKYSAELSNRFSFNSNLNTNIMSR